MKSKINKPGLEDLTFEGRNKEYGSYVIIKNSARRIRVSFVYALGIFVLMILIVGGGIMIPWMSGYDLSQDISINTVIVRYDPTLITILSEPIKEIQDKEKKQRFTEPKIADEVKELFPAKEVKKPEEKLVPEKSQEESLKDSLNKIELEAKEKSLLAERKADTIIYIEQTPQFPGGPEALKLYISHNLQYPVDALRRKLQGTVVLNFIIEKDGSIGRVIISKRVDPVIDFEAVRIIESMPHWKSAVKQGKPIASMLVIPISFALR